MILIVFANVLVRRWVGIKLEFSFPETWGVKKHIILIRLWDSNLLLIWGNILGVPLHHRKVSPHTYNYLFEKVNNHLNKWKSKHLSFVGRLNSAKLDILTISGYAMQTNILPKAIYNEIEMVERDFI